MYLNKGQRASSTGYRPPDRGPAADAGDPPRRMQGAADRRDPVKQERAWREAVQRERRSAADWERNWGFLRSCDQMGQPRSKKPLPSHVSPFSDRIPNTTNQVYGSRLSTPLAAELIRLDRLYVGLESHRRRKL